MLRVILAIAVSTVILCNCTPDKTEPAAIAPDDLAQYETCPIDRGQPAPLSATVASLKMNIPVGTSLCSYAIRGNSFYRDPRFSGIIGSSYGYYDRLEIKALLLDRGDRRVMMVRLPISTVSDQVRSRIIDLVQEKTGENLCGELLLTSMHTHSGPARYSAIPDRVTFVGLDTTQVEIFNRITEQAADTIVAALEGERVPVELGYTIEQHFDPDDLVTVDRRCTNDGLYDERGLSTAKEDQMLLIRLDRTDGTPFAAVANFAIHGTVFVENNHYFSTDAPGMIETKFSEELARENNSNEVPFIMFFNGAAGETNPWNAADLGFLGPNGLAQAERNAGYAAESLVELYSRIDNFTDSPTLDYRVRRVPLSREVLGYAPWEWIGLSGSQVEMAGYCVPFDLGCSQGQTGKFDFWPENQLMCVLDMTDDLLAGSKYVTGYTRTVLGLLKIDDLLIAALPGEPTTPIADIIRQKAGELGFSAENTAIFGYANDYQFYFTLREDWFRGGYEAAANIWGPQLGQYLVDLTAELIGEASGTRTTAPSLARPQYLPMTEEYTDDFEFEIFNSNNPGTIIDDPPAEIERMNILRLAFIGGDPAVDMPSFTVERRTPAGNFAPLLTVDGKTLDENSYRTRVDFGWSSDGQPIGPWPAVIMDFPPPSTGVGRISVAAPQKMEPSAGAEPVWTISWQLMPDEATGTFRLAISGQAMIDEGLISYGSSESPIYSESFEIAPSSAISVNGLFVDAAQDLVGFYAHFPAIAEGYRLIGNLSLPHRITPLTNGAATLEVTAPGHAPVTVTATAEGDGRFSAPFNADASGQYTISISPGALHDTHGNFNSIGTSKTINVD